MTGPGGARLPARAGRPGPQHRAVRLRRPGVTAVLCDLDGVVLTVEPMVLRAIERQHRLRRGTLREVVHQRPSALLAQAGLIDYRAWLEQVRATLPPPVVAAWLAHHGTVNRPVVTLLQAAARAGLRLILLANGTARLHDDLAHHRLTALGELYLSAQLGYLKPDPRAYHRLLRRTALHPEQVLYIDDCPHCVQVGQGLGMRTHRYVNPRLLQPELAAAA